MCVCDRRGWISLTLIVLMLGMFILTWGGSLLMLCTWLLWVNYIYRFSLVMLMNEWDIDLLCLFFLFVCIMINYLLFSNYVKYLNYQNIQKKIVKIKNVYICLILDKKI